MHMAGAPGGPDSQAAPHLPPPPLEGEGRKEVMVMFCVAPAELMPSAAEWPEAYKKHASWRKAKLSLEAKEAAKHKVCLLVVCFT